jgi:AmmeMemoRadiSam system protein A
MQSNYEQILLKLARLAIMESLTGQKLIDKQQWIENYPDLSEKRATFVTLYKSDEKREQLRGCIGSLVPYRSLIDDIIENARAAAFKDPRFSPVQPDEMNKIQIEISLLSLPVKLSYQSVDELRQIIREGKHGVVLKLSGHRATFLPQVWKELPDFDLFFKHLCRKAGLPDNCLDYHPEIDVYEVKEIKE